MLPAFSNTKTIEAGNSTVTKTTDSFASSLTAGFVWDINENCALDAYINLSDTPSFLNGVLGGSLHLGFKYKM